MNRTFFLIFFGFSGVLLPSVALPENISKSADVIDSESSTEVPRIYLKNETETDIYNATDGGNESVTEVEDVQQKLYFPYSLRIIQEVMGKLKNQRCVKDTIIVLNAMTKHEKWALELFDSFPKFPVGILDSNYYQLGNFDECIGAKQTGTNLTSPVQGQYCLADIHFESRSTHSKRLIRSAGKPNSKDRFKYNNTVIHWGICLPASCSPSDAEIFTKEIFSSAADNFEVKFVSVDHKNCYYDHESPYSKEEIIYGCVIGFFLIFTALATGLHIWSLRQKKTAVAYNVDAVRAQNSTITKELFRCFSILHTTKKFLQIKPNELNLECICGVRFISMMVIISSHSMVYTFGGPIENKKFITEEMFKVENSPFTNGTILVDTFLLLSGFLFCRLLLIELDKRKGKLNIFVLYIGRYIRLTPVYMVVIGFQATWLHRLGTGPFWESKVGVERDRCRSSWWANILYINNYVNADQLCMFQAYYLAVDYHLFIIAPILIYLLWKWRRVGETALLLCTVIAVAIPFWYTYMYNYDPTLLSYPPEIQDISTNFYFSNVYIKTHMRASSYCIGLFFGYLVHRLQSSGSKMAWYVTYPGWVLCISFALLSLFSIIFFFYPDHKENQLESAIYASLHRMAWSLAIGWILLVCITDNSEILNKLLSWKPMIPLSRLTYCAYLANGSVEVYGMGIQKQALYLTRYAILCKIVTHIIVTFVIAFVLCIIFESPIHGLEKMMIRRHDPTVKEHKNNSTVRPLEET